MKVSKSFEEYYKEYYPKVYGSILQRITNRETAEDLTMDVFVKCYEKFDEFDESKATFGTWVYVILKNRLKNYYRDRKQFDDIDECTEYVSGFEDEIIAAEYIKNLRDTLADALGTLNEIQRKVVILKYFKGESAPEIAQKTGLTAVNVRVILSRAIAKLKTYFEENNITWED